MDNHANPLVSILTPSFNQARWLADNMRSVASQTYPAVEHIVMDGGSADGSVVILRHASPAVRWRSEPDRGQSCAITAIPRSFLCHEIFRERRPIMSNASCVEAHP
jgi:glycosyltransferase involved in cell wall biosynthesis